jgi:hypothetical protein
MKSFSVVCEFDEIGMRELQVYTPNGLAEKDAAFRLLERLAPQLGELQRAVRDAAREPVR